MKRIIATIVTAAAFAVPATASTPTATDLWRAIRAEPGYQPGAPVTSVSGEATVSGEVNGASALRSSWG
jgi:hypothetical protein